MYQIFKETIKAWTKKMIMGDLACKGQEVKKYQVIFVVVQVMKTPKLQ
jgi:hypothetical protein